MQSKTKFRRPMLAALLCGTSLALASPQLLAQTLNASAAAQQLLSKRATAAAFAAAQRDFAQFVANQTQSRAISGAPTSAPTDFPLEITNIEDLKDAVVDYGFPVYTIDPADLLAGRSTMKNMAKPTNQWRFVITLNKHPIGLATVEQNRGRYETVSYGAAVLAKDVDALMGVHGNEDKSNLRFLRIFQARSDLLEVVTQDDGRARYAPLHSARESLLIQQRASKDGKAPDTLVDEAEILQPLRSAVKNNMDAHR